MAMTPEEVAAWLRGQGVSEGVIADEAGYVANKYADPGEDPMAVLQSSLGGYLQRSQSGGDRSTGGYNTQSADPAVTTDYGTTSGRPASTSASTSASAGAPITTFGSSSPHPAPTGADTASLNGLFDQINTDLMAAGHPIVDVPGINLNEDIDASLRSIMQGTDTTSIDTNNAIQGLLASVGQGRNEDRLAKRQLQATETAQLAQQGLMDQARTQLADQGTIGLPGAPQGLETAGARRVAERVAVPFAQSLRDISINESQLADDREINALQLATGWSNAQATRVLQAAAAGTDRQRILSDIALGTLDRNMAWNQFLAQFGLEREKFMQDVRMGNMANISNVISQFQQFLQQLRGGFIGNE